MFEGRMLLEGYGIAIIKQNIFLIFLSHCLNYGTLRLTSQENNTGIVHIRTSTINYNQNNPHPQEVLDV